MTIKTSTFFALLAEYNSTTIELEKISTKYFGLTPREANKKANLKQLPIPAFRCGTQKAAWIIHTADLANLIDKQREKANQDWQKMNGDL